MLILIVRFIFISILIIIPSFAFAQETTGTYDIAVAFRYSVPTGDIDVLIGNENNGYSWTDLYQNGMGASIEVSKRFSPLIALHLGAAYDSFSAANNLYKLVRSAGVPVEASGQFSTLSPLSLYLGEKFYLLPGQKNGASGIVDPYVRVDLGMTSFNSVDFNSNYGSFSVGGSTTVFSYSLGVGANLWTSSSFAEFIEVKYHDYGKPGLASDTLKTFPEVSLGGRYIF